MKKFLLLIALIFVCQSAHCQINKKGRIVDIVIHKVEMGETIVMICKKYLVNPNTIYGANKFIIDGINEGMVLQIPVARKVGQEYATTQYADPVLDDDVMPEAIAAANNPIATSSIIKDTLAIAENTVAVVKKIKPTKQKKTIATKEPEVVDENPIANNTVETKEPEVVAENPVVKEPETVIENPVADNQPEKVVETKPTIIDKPIVKETPTVAVTETEKDPVFEVKRMAITKIDRDEETQHIIQKKETLFGISKKYDVSMEEITERNVDLLKNGLVVGQVLYIPANKKIIGWGDEVAKTDDKEGITSKSDSEKTQPTIVEKPIAAKTDNKPVALKLTETDNIENGFTNHKVQPKETLYSLSKKYFTSPEAILANNENVRKKGLGIGMNIKIPVSDTGKAVETGAVAELDKKLENFVAPVRTLDSNDILHKVEAKETLTSLSKKYSVSVYDIRSNNESIMSKGLQVGQTIRIPKAKKAEIAKTIDDIAVEQAKENTPKNTATDKASNEEIYVIGDIITTVQANESIEDIAKKYDVTPEEIIQNNATLIKDGKVKTGQVIKVPANKAAVEFSPETFD